MYRILLPKVAFRNGPSIKAIFGHATTRVSHAARRISARPNWLIALAGAVVFGALVIIP